MSESLDENLEREIKSGIKRLTRINYVTNVIIASGVGYLTGYLIASYQNQNYDFNFQESNIAITVLAAGVIRVISSIGKKQYQNCLNELKDKKK